MTDIVYITGGKSMWQYNELRYSLRSLCKHLKNMGNVYVVGKLPEFLHTNRVVLDYEMNEVSYIDGNGNIGIGGRIKSSTQLFHIPAEDHLVEKKETRLYRKHLLACRDERISDTALFCYDDEYLLTDHDADIFPYYYDGTIQMYYKRIWRTGTHKECAGNTIKAVAAEARNFDVHCPMLINRHDFIDVMKRYDWNGKKDGFLVKSSYANSVGAIGPEIMDSKINHPDGTQEEYRKMIAGRQWFSTGDNCNFGVLSELMEELYPEMSPYEL